MLRVVIFLSCATILLLVSGDDDTKLVTTKSGRIRGKLEKTLWFKKPFYSFKGIPYAKPPVKDLRFKV